MRRATSVTTWADGYGVWHASVALTDDVATIDDAADVARDAITDEINARQIHQWGAVRVVLDRVTNHGTVVFDEVWWRE